jgi:hypothetical protein
MLPVFAHSIHTGRIFFHVGLICFLLALIGSWAYAARRGVPWIYAVILLPPAILVLLFKEAKYRICVLLALVSLGLSLWGIIGLDFWPKDMTLWERTKFLGSLFDGKSRRQRSAQLDEELRKLRQSVTLEQRKQIIREMQQRLEEKKAKLDPDDEGAQLIFAGELEAYLEELALVKAEMAKAGQK